MQLAVFTLQIGCTVACLDATGSYLDPVIIAMTH